MKRYWRQIGLLTGLVVLVSGLIVNIEISSRESAKAQSPPPSPVGGVVAHAEWVNRPATISELADVTTVAVVARVLGITEGPSLVSDAPDVPPIPTQRITLSVEERWLSSSVPDEIVLFKTGSESEWIEGDPPYRLDQRYALFLQQRPDGAYIPAAPDGRLEIVSGKAQPVISGPLGEQLRGKLAVELRGLAETASQKDG